MSGQREGTPEDFARMFGGGAPANLDVDGGGARPPDPDKDWDEDPAGEEHAKLLAQVFSGDYAAHNAAKRKADHDFLARMHGVKQEGEADA
jgi:hypothetical protein